MQQLALKINFHFRKKEILLIIKPTILTIKQHQREPINFGWKACDVVAD